MKQFLVFVKKEFYHILRDRWTMIILVILPIMMIILFGFGINTEVKNSKFAIYDPSNDIATQGIINKLNTSEYFTIADYIDNPNEIEQIFREGDIGFVLIFSENFYQNMLHTGDAQIQMITDATDPNTANTLVNYATALIGEYQRELMQINQIPYQIVPEVKLLYNPGMVGAYNTVPGVMGMVLMLICAMMTSVSIAREKELGTMEVLLVSPMKPFLIIISKMVPYFTISIFNLISLLLLAVYVLHVPMNGSLLTLGLVSLIFIFVSLALGLLISSVVETQLVALLISGMVLMLPVILLSGLMFPIETMPLALQAIAQVIPAKWFIVALRNIMIKGLGFSSIIREVVVLSVMAVVLVIASFKRFKNRLE